MAKRKARELLENGNGPEEKTLSSGVVVSIAAFPVGLFEDLNVKSIELYPDPPPPKKTIKTLGGDEEIDNLDDPDYLAEVRKVKNQRGALISEAVLDICVQLDLTPWESTIRRLEKYAPKFSDDPEERRLEFLTRYALRGKSDYTLVVTSAMAQMIADDAEVAKRLESFRDQVEGAAASDNETPSAPEGERVEVQQEV